QRRHDLIPNLVKAVDAYAKYERATLVLVTHLREQSRLSQGVAERGDVEEQLTSGIHKLVALAEHYPDLKASDNFLKLQGELAETENYLQFARRYYNASVRDYNIMVESVPSNVVAGVFDFSQREYFQKASDDVAKVPVVGLEQGE
ncbi:MAG: LemA family protein, partial [Pseudomonadota bacterium]